MVVNSPRGRGPRADGAYIRRAAGVAGIPCLTTAAAALAAAEGMADWAGPPPPGRGPSRTSTPAVGERPAGSLRPVSRRRRRAGADGAPPVDLAVTVGSVELPNPVMTASGTAGHGAELAAYRRPRRARRGRREVAVGRARGRATRRPGSTRPRPGCSTASGCRARASPPGSPTTCPPLLATGARVVACIWGRSVDDYRRAADAAGRRPGPGGRGRGQPQLPERRGPGATCSPTRPRRPRRSWPPPTACGRPRWAKLSPNRRRPRADRRRRRGRRRRGGHPGQHRDGAWRSTPRPAAPTRLGRAGRRAVGPGHPPGGGAGRPRRRTPPAPTLPIVGVGGVVDGRAAVELLAGRAPRRCRWARPPSPIRGPPHGCATTWKTGAAVDGTSTAAELIGGDP